MGSPLPVFFLAYWSLFARASPVGGRQDRTRRSLQVAAASVSCFGLVIADSRGDGWNGATYTISDVDADVVANGTMDDGFKKTDEVCFSKVPACYAIQVTAGIYPSEISWSLGDGAVSGGAPAESDFYVSGDVLFSSCTTSSPTISPAPTHNPSTSSPSVKFAPSMTVLTTFTLLQSALERATTRIQEVEGVLLFQSRLDVVSAKQSIVGVTNAALDGGTATSLFRLENTTLQLEDITLQNGYAQNGGCVEARVSTLVLIRTLVTNCEAVAYGGGFFFEFNSILHAFQSEFNSNKALTAGVA